MKHLLCSAIVCLLLAPCLHAADTPSFIELGSGEEEACFVAFSPDVSKIATTSRRFIAKIWDADTGKELQIIDANVDGRHPFTTHYYPKLTSAAFSPDGRRIATSSWGPLVRIWDVESGKELQTLTGHAAVVHSIRFSLDGKNIVTASEDRSARIWDAESGKELRQLEHPRMKDVPGSDRGAFADFSPDGKKIITFVHGDPVARIWETDTGEKLHELPGHSSSVGSAFFLPDGKKVITTDWNRNVRIWDAESGEIMQTMDNTNSTNRIPPVSPDGKILLSTGDAKAKICDIESGKELYRLRREDGNGYAIDVWHPDLSPDGKKIAAKSTYSHGNAHIWDIDTGKVVQTLTGHKDNVFFARFSPDGKKVAVPTGDTHHGYIVNTRIWKLE